MLRILLHGASGRMGNTVAELVRREDDMEIVAGVDRYAPTRELGFEVYDALDKCAVEADVMIDFSQPGALSGVLEYCMKRGLPLVLCTTGFGEQDIKHIEQASTRIPVFRSANMSLGINLIARLAGEAAAFFGDSADIEIVETHHRGKADAPSGTAVLLADEINAQLNGAKEYVFGRHGAQARRKPAELGIHAVRGGSVVGDHEVMFLGDEERVTISHSAQSRTVFAYGAIEAARYLSGKPPRLYDMHDLLVDKSTVTNVYVERDVAVLTLRGVDAAGGGAAEFFGRMAALNYNLDMISQAAPVAGRVDVSVSLGEADAYRALNALAREQHDWELEICDRQVKVTVEGLGMQRQSGVAARIFALLAKKGVTVTLVTTSETKVSLLVPAADERKAALALREAFELN